MIKNFKKVVFQKYATFEGRASRSEYWHFVLAWIIINFIVSLVMGFAGLSPALQAVVVNIMAIAIIIPSIAVGVRRMHDSNKSGWFMLVPVYNLYLAVIKGTTGDNRFGPDPLSPVPVQQPTTL